LSGASVQEKRYVDMREMYADRQANVYHAQISDNAPPHIASKPSLAVKIYRTSILSFRARQAYIVGEHRFKGEYSSSRNARKMVKVWAEKELRNLRRLEQAGIRAPRVVEGKENVLVMEFLGVGDE
jgi:RIO kinase 1